MIISISIPIMRNVSGKCVEKTKNIHFMFNKLIAFSPKNRAVYEIMSTIL